MHTRGASRSELPRGAALLHDPSLNKGTAFTEAERDALGLRGLLPPRVLTIEEQVERVLENFRRKPTDLEQVHLPDRAAGPQRDALLPRGGGQPRGDDADHLHADGRPGLPAVRPHLPAAARPLHQRRRPRPRRASCCATGRTRTCASSSSPTASASSASATWAPTAWASRSASSRSTPPAPASTPTQCLPVMLDVGTDNEALLDDPLYIGLHAARACAARRTTRSSRSSSTAAQSVFPGALIQFEDFANHNAFRLLRQVPRPHLHASTTTSRAPPPWRWPGMLLRRCASPGGTLARPDDPVPRRRRGRRSASPT